MAEFLHYSSEVGKYVKCDADVQLCPLKTGHISESEYKARMPANITTVEHVFVHVEKKLIAEKTPGEPNKMPDMDGLCSSDFASIRATAASSPLISVDGLRKLSKDSERTVREEVARNMLTDMETLHSLSQDYSWRVRYNVANNFVASKSSLQELASDNNVQVREQVADNFNTSVETLTFMVDNETDEDVLSVLAKRKFDSPEIYSTLYSKGSNQTKMSLAMNSTTPKEILVQLQDEGFILGHTNLAKMNQQIVH